LAVSTMAASSSSVLISGSQASPGWAVDLIIVQILGLGKQCVS
jgi:hypothetical protein